MAEQKPSGVYSAIDAAFWISTPGRINCKYMHGSQPGKPRDVSVLRVNPVGGAILLEVADSSMGTKTYRLDKIKDARMVSLNADNFMPEDMIPSIRFDDGNHLRMESGVLLRQVLEEFVSNDPRYPFPSFMRPVIENFLKGCAKE